MPSIGSGYVLMTDRAWPDACIEEELCTRAGRRLVDATGHAAPMCELVADAVGILVNWASVDRGLIAAAPQLRAITRLGVGVDNIDLVAAAERDIAVSRIPDYCVEEVSDHVLALVLSRYRNIVRYTSAVGAGQWRPGEYEQRRIAALTIGIWGAGASGLRTAEKFRALGCRVLIDDRHSERASHGIAAVAVEKLLRDADVVSLHLPATPETVGIVDGAVLDAMRDGALLVNTGRGALVDLEALRGHLDVGRLQAALDVLPDEPDVPTWLRGRDDVLITPHVAFSSRESITDLRRRATDDLLRMLDGEPATFPVAEWRPGRKKGQDT